MDNSPSPFQATQVSNLQNSYTTIQDRPVDPESSRVLSRQVATGAGYDKSILKKVASGYLTLVKASFTEDAEVRFAHHLGFTPSFLVYKEDTDDDGNIVYTAMPQIIIDGAGVTLERNRVHVTDTELVITVHAPSGTPNPNPQYQAAMDRTYRYYLFQEPAD